MDIVRDLLFYIVIAIYLVIGIRISHVNYKILKDEGIEYIPPSSIIGIVLFWLWDLIYVNFKY